MAQENLADQTLEPSDQPQSQSDPSLSRNVSFSRLNAQAPEFVPSPRSSVSRTDLNQPRPHIGPVHVYPPPAAPAAAPFHVIPVQNHHNHHHHIHQFHQQQQHHNHQYYGVGGGFGEQESVATQKGQMQAPGESDHGAPSRNGISEEAAQKILNQVEYYFSDLNLATTDHLMRFISKDPEGYVPISVVAAFKKIKALISIHSQLANVLRNSSKLVVSEDGKKIRRLHPLTESDMEELQSRIIIAENLPEDHCHQNLLKVFSTVGSVKTIRTCQPQPSNGGASSASRSSKADGMLFSNKLHAFVEYESVELAEKAVADLNDEGNWRSGLRVRLMLRRASKPAHARGKKGPDGEGHYEEDDASTSEQQPNEKRSEAPSQQSDVQSHEHTGEEHVNDKEGGQRKGRGRGRGKGRGRPQYHHNNRGNHVGTPPSTNSIAVEQPTVAKQPPGPRMPDGTRGFAMGRGKPVL